MTYILWSSYFGGCSDIDSNLRPLGFTIRGFENKDFQSAKTLSPVSSDLQPLMICNLRKRMFRKSVSSRHSAEKRNPECSHRISRLCIIYWIPLFSGMTTCHRLVRFLILCTRSPVLVFFRRSVSSRHSAEKRNPECSHRISRLCIIYWIPLFSGMTTCHRLVKFLILCTRSPVLVFFRRSVSSRHSAEKRNPECSHRISRLCIIYWIPLFSGMTTCHRLVRFLILCTRSPVLVFFRRSVSSRHSAEKAESRVQP